MPGPALVTRRPPGPPPEFAEHEDEQAEAEAVAARARDLVAGGVPARRIAVLVRVNAQTGRFERALADAGVAYRVRGERRFFDRLEVRQAMGLLRAAARGPGGHAEARAGAAPSAAAEVRHVLAGLGLAREAPPGPGLARARWESLEALAQLAEDFCAGDPSATLGAVVAEFARRAAIAHPPHVDGVALASLHAAKGLEWDVVFLPGLAEGVLPIVHARTDEAVAEERRLLYVGITRARERVLLSWSLSRSPGGPRTRAPSRFLEGLRPGAGLSRRNGYGATASAFRAGRTAKAGA